MVSNLKLLISFLSGGPEWVGMAFSVMDVGPFLLERSFLGVVGGWLSNALHVFWCGVACYSYELSC